MTIPKPIHTIQADGIRLSVFHTKAIASANDVSIMIERDQGRSGEAWYPTATIRGGDLHALSKVVHEVLLLLSTSNGAGKPLSPPTPRVVSPALPISAAPAGPASNGTSTAHPNVAPRDVLTQKASATHEPARPVQSAVTSRPTPSEPAKPAETKAVSFTPAKVSVPQPTGSTSTTKQPARNALARTAIKPASGANGSKPSHRAIAESVSKRRAR